MNPSNIDPLTGELRTTQTPAYVSHPLPWSILYTRQQVDAFIANLQTQINAGGGGGGSVGSVFGRTGAVVAQSGDYTAAQVGALPSTESIDQIATANPSAASWSNNGKKITSIANGGSAQDAAAFGQIPTALPPNGSAGGDLTGTYPNPTLSSTANVQSIVNAIITGQYLPIGGGTLTGNLTLSTHNIITDATTGTMIATASTQKLGFFGATPVIQQTGDVLTALSNLGLVTSPTLAAGDIPTLNQNTTGNAGSVTGLTFVSGKTLTVDNILELAGTDSTKMTFPASSATIAGLGIAETWSALQTFGNNISLGGEQLNVSSLATGQALVSNGTNWINSPAFIKPSVGATSATTTASTTNVMAGFAQLFTPAVTGNVLVIVIGSMQQTTANAGAKVQIAYAINSSGAPSNGAVATGTLAGNAWEGQGGAVGAPGRTTFVCMSRITGLSAGTQYWFDCQYATVTAADVASLVAVQYLVVETL